MFALSSFRPFVVHVAACWYHFFDSFSSPRFYFARLLSPFAHLFFVLSVCFASQTPGLCSAFLFGSLLPCTRFICYVSVLHLANTGFVQCFFIPFPSRLHTFYFSCVCASPRKLRVCVVLLSSVPFPFCHIFLLSVCFASQTMILRSAVFPFPLWVFVRFSDLCTLWQFFFVSRISICTLRVCAVHSLHSLFFVDLFNPFLFAILCFEYFASERVFCLVLFSLPSHYLEYLSCFVRSSFASQTMVLCSSFLSPLF